ncbi:MAG: asparaginase [Bacteroidota bacterium]|nr:asparaginase [Bacteroidota bacterium]
MCKHKIIFFLLICFSYGLLNSQDAAKPKVLIITTGGTIASSPGAPLIEGSELVHALPQLTQYGDIEVEEFIRIGSSKMTPAIWLDLLKRIDVVLNEQPDLACIVITHGTDTMEETAFFLNLTHRRKTPIILVGSMRSSGEISADGPANLLNAVRVGISREAIGKGVLVVLNDNISAGRDLVKMHNSRVDAFPSTELGFIGFADPDTVIFYRSSIKAHTIESEFDILELDSLPKVDIVKDFAGFDSEILSYFVSRPNNGLVISSFAGGRLSSDMIEGVTTLPGNHKPIVISSGIRGGRIMGSNQPGSPVIIASDLPPNKARILLMLALTNTRDMKQIQHYFDKY